MNLTTWCTANSVWVKWQMWLDRFAKVQTWHYKHVLSLIVVIVCQYIWLCTVAELFVKTLTEYYSAILIINYLLKSFLSCNKAKQLIIWCVQKPLGKDYKLMTTFIFMSQGSYPLVKIWNTICLNLYSYMPFSQHLSSQQKKEPLPQKCVCEKMEDGDSLTTWTGKKAKLLKHESLNNFFSFASWRKRKHSRFRDCEMLFFSFLFWGTRKPKKPWLQQFSNHSISKLRPFQMLCVIQISWDSLQFAVWVLQCLRAGWNWEKLYFFTVPLHIFLLYQP